jgi:hypothetical protein
VGEASDAGASPPPASLTAPVSLGLALDASFAPSVEPSLVAFVPPSSPWVPAASLLASFAPFPPHATDVMHAKHATVVSRASERRGAEARWPSDMPQA